MRAVELGEGLLVLAAHHDLCLGVQRFDAVGLQILDGEAGLGRELDEEPGLAALAVRDRVRVALVAGVFGELGAARAGGRIDEVELDEAAEGAVGLHAALVGDGVELVAFEPAAQRALHDRVGERNTHAGLERRDLAAVLHEHAAQGIERKDGVLVLVEGADDAAHVDALEPGLDGDGAGDAGLKCAHAAALGGET